MTDEDLEVVAFGAAVWSCGYCGSTDVDALARGVTWPRDALGRPQDLQLTCPACGRSILVEGRGDQWVSGRLMAVRSEP